MCTVPAVKGSAIHSSSNQIHDNSSAAEPVTLQGVSHCTCKAALRQEQPAFGLEYKT